MARALTSAMLAEIVKQTVSPILLYEGEFNSGTIHLWSGVGTIAWNGNTYTGAGQVLSVSAVEETVEVRAAGVQIGLSGLPATLVSLALNDARQGKKGRLWLGFMSMSNGKALSFNGTTQYVNGGNLSASVPTNGPASIEGWFNFTQFAVAHGTNVGLHTQLYQHVANNYFYLGGGGADYFAVGATLTVGVSYHIVLTYNGTHESSLLYVNGVQYPAAIQTPSTGHAALNPFVISDVPSPFSGVMDNTRVYSRVLSAAEVADHYAGNFTNNTGLVGYWPFEEGTGTTTADQSGNGNTGTLVNAPAWVSGIGPVEQGRIILDPYQIFTGLLDVPTMDETGDTANITVSYENRLVGLLTANDRRYTPQDQAVEFPGDTGFDFVAGLQDATIVW